MKGGKNSEGPRLARLSHPFVLLGLPLAILLASLLITYQVFRSAQRDAEGQVQAYFDFRVREAIDHIEQRVQTYEQVLRGAAGLFEASNWVGREEYRKYVSTLRLEDNYPGIQGVGFSLIVPASKKESHIASIRREGFPEYTIRPAGKRDLYSSIIYLEPFADRNLRAFGYDMYSEPVRRAAMQKAVDSGEASLSGKVRLVQESGKREQAGFLMYLPVYGNDAPHGTLEERRANAIGWVYAPFRMDDFMVGAQGERAADLDIEIYDGNDISEALLMYDSDNSILTGAPHDTAYLITRQLVEVDHPWTIRIQAQPSLLSRIDTSRPRLFAVVGTIGSLLFSFLVWMLLTGRERAIRAAQKMNEELIESESLFRGFFGQADFLAGILDNDGRLIDVNEKALALIGKPSSLVLGKKFADTPWWSLQDSREKMLAILQQVRTGRTAVSEVLHLAIEGKQLWIHFIAVPIHIPSDAGSRLLIAVTGLDITERKRAETELKESEQRFRLMADSAPVLIWMAGTDKLCMWFNKVWLEFTGRSMEQEVGNGWAEGVHPDDYQRCLDYYVSHFDRREPFRMEYRLRRHDGEYRWIVDSGAPRFDESGNFAGYIGSCFDVTESKRFETRLLAEQWRLNNIIEGTRVGTWEWNVQTGEANFNRYWANIIGYELDELEPISIETWNRFVHPDDRELSKKMLEIHFSGGIDHYECEARMRHKDGYWVWVLDRGKVATWTEDGKPLMMYGTHQDITQRKLAEEQMLHAAQHDVLTGLPNRFLFEDRLRQQLAMAQRDRERFALMFMDMDRFKPINDRYGHDIGDLLLKEAAKRLQECCRSSDTVARVGGDEFVVLLPEIEREEDALLVAEKMRAALGTPFEIKGLSLQVSLSIGIATYPEHGANAAELSKHADIAMYHAKHGGRDNAQLYRPEMAEVLCVISPDDGCLSNESNP